MILNQKTTTLMTKILNPRSPLKEERGWDKLYLMSSSKYESEQQGKANQTVQLPSKKEKLIIQIYYFNRILYLQ